MKTFNKLAHTHTERDTHIHYLRVCAEYSEKRTDFVLILSLCVSLCRHDF